MPVLAHVLMLAQAAPPTRVWQVSVLSGVLLLAVLGLVGLAIITLLRRAARRSMLDDAAASRHGTPPVSAWQEAGRRAEPQDHDPDVDPLDETR